MKKIKIIALIISAVLFVSGLTLSIISACMLNFDFSKLDTTVYEDKTSTIDVSFDAIDVATVSDDIVFDISPDNSCKIEYTETDKITYSIGVSDNTLKIGYDDKSYNIIGLNFFNIKNDSKMIIHIPAKTYTSLKADSVSGNINTDAVFGKAGFEKSKLHTISGDIQSKLSSGSAEYSSTSGDINAEGEYYSDISISTVSGDIKLNEFDTGTLDVHTTSGDVSINNIKIVEGKIETVSGDIEGSLNGRYDITTDTVSGDIKVNSSVNAKRKLSLKTVSGDMIIR